MKLVVSKYLKLLTMRCKIVNIEITKFVNYEVDMSDNSVLQLRENGQITLPTSIRRKTNLKAGDLLDVKVDDDGTIRLTPQMAIDRSQAYFWSKRWQTGELQAEEDIDAGRVKNFADVDDLINDLESE
ncbi:MAG: hypothetical protein CVU43_04850 [Chloroflexi bacterium HGW-Chloroflexi-5]|nr:MAG: hypothetical protein CVU43_04850 [Chloroflexi bacterium HGW-Chloroflexi-5]